jgi:GNAT superfamily N-acetyltransferase
MPDVSVRVEELTEQDRRTVIDGLIEYNRRNGFVWDRRPLGLVARSPTGVIVGGLLGEINLKWLFISALWVDEAMRDQGTGSTLMHEAEEEARRLGCIGVYLDTYSFQARPFYEKLGYRLFGELQDCPPNQTKHYLYKRLS